eukprot:2790371-Alexandrium_andersonii.AAC.1
MPNPPATAGIEEANARTRKPQSAIHQSTVRAIVGLLARESQSSYLARHNGTRRNQVDGLFPCCESTPCPTRRDTAE